MEVRLLKMRTVRIVSLGCSVLSLLPPLSAFLHQVYVFDAASVLQTRAGGPSIAS